MTLGLMAKDCEIRIDYDKLRKDRVRKTNEQMVKEGIATLLVFDQDWIRYITSTKVNDWANNKLLRSALMVAGEEPILYELGSAIAAKKKLCPWIADRMFPSIGTWRGAFPRAVGEENAKKFASMVKDHLTQYGVQNEPVGIDLSEILIIRALEDEGIKVVDGQQCLLEASKIKTEEEVELIETSISIVEAAFWEVVNRAAPGVRESDIAGFMRETMYRLGSEELQNINVISGNRAYPHPHDWSDRMLRMGDMLFIDVVSVFNGYKTCYYQTFVIGKPSSLQLDVYQKSYDWLFDAVAMVKPGVSTAEIAEIWPSYKEMGLSSEAEAFALQVAHGIGITHWGKPVISRFFSFDNPEVIEENMVMAFETYCGEGNDAARIEEQFVVTKDGMRQLSKFPSANLISCPCVGALLP
ncbi:MAG: M24 family metallopeptidase [Lentisphaeria bacterium]|jgi:Xaa-Pro dipeptidase|nr:M24 family metallopeptidase [Lentisphaeria bacterium]MDP7740155.1 M24 family metallopeptidase [Lentisphaeria bacterium]